MCKQNRSNLPILAEILFLLLGFNNTLRGILSYSNHSRLDWRVHKGQSSWEQLL